LALNKAEDAHAEGNLLNLPYSDSDPETEHQPTEGEQYPNIPTSIPPGEQEPPEIGQSSAEPTVSKSNKINQLLSLATTEGIENPSNQATRVGNPCQNYQFHRGINTGGNTS